MAADLIEQAGIAEIDPAILQKFGKGMIVTPKEIDSQVSDVARVVGYAINMCMHPELSVEDITNFLS
jgi:spore protease